MKKILIGQIVKPQGIKGELKVKPYVDSLQELNNLKEVFIEKELNPRRVVSISVRQGFAYLLLSGILDRNTAETFRNKKLYLEESRVKEALEEDEYLIEELIGCVVKDNIGKQIGILEDIDNYGSLDVYTVKIDGGYLRFPNAPDVIEVIDEKNKLIIVNKKRLGEVAVYEN